MYSVRLTKEQIAELLAGREVHIVGDQQYTRNGIETSHFQISVINAIPFDPPRSDWAGLAAFDNMKHPQSQ